jgi:hypothetical protein
VTKKARGDIPHPVVPRHASAEGPLADARGDKKGAPRGDKKRSGSRRQKKEAQGDKKGSG